MEKVLIFDASSLISISMAGLIEELKELKKSFNGSFLITNEIKKELVDIPLQVKKFKLEALRINELIKEKILEFPEKFNIQKKEISKETEKYLKLANTIFETKNNCITLIHSGEASCLGLSNLLTQKNIKNVLLIDERTTRVLIESPKNIKEILEKKLHSKIVFKKDNFKEFADFKILRSVELIFFAYKKGIIKIKDGNDLLDALLYALKYKGCAVSFEEIEELKEYSKNIRK